MHIFTEIIILFSAFHFQILVAELMFCLSLQRKIRNPFNITIGIIIYCAMPYFFPNTYFWPGFMIGKWFTLSFMFMFLLSSLLLWVSFEIPSRKELIFYVTAAYIIQHMVHTLSRTMIHIFHLESSIYRMVLQIVITILLYSIFYLIFVRRLTRGDVTGVSNIFLITFTSTSIFMIYFLSLWSSTHEVVTIGRYLYDFLSCVLLLIIQFGMFEWSKLQKQNVIMQQLLHVEKEHHAMSMENIELINMKCHDLKYQVSALCHIDNRNEQIKSIKEIERAIMIYDLSIKTGNEALDIILAEKKLHIEKYSINFSCIADGSKLDFICTTDVYSLFGNALDNAIESVCKIEDVEKRIISLNISCRGNCLIIHMYNYCDQTIIFEEGLPITSKEEKHFHGYGIRSMQYLTEKYGGTMSILYENNFFKLNILFPLENNKCIKI